MTNALGCLVSDLRQDIVNTVNRPLDEIDMPEVHKIMAEQRARGEAINAAEKDEIVATTVLHSMDMQFKGQTHLITVAIDDDRISGAALHDRFAEAYFARFAVHLPEIRPVLVNVNTSVIGHRREIALEGLLDAGLRCRSLSEAVRETRSVYFDGAWFETPIYDREALPVAAVLEGPAIVEQLDATIVLEPDATMTTDQIGNSLIDVPLLNQQTVDAAPMEAQA